MLTITRRGGAMPDLEVRLSREMGLLDITMIGVGAMIGAGIFVLTGIAAGVAGPGLLLAFLLNGFVTLFAAAAYAELGSSFHDAGGGYLWVKTGLPDPQGFMSGWMSWFAHAVACSLYALGFGAYFKMVLPAVGITSLQTPLVPIEKWLAVGAVALFALINYRGAAETGKTGNVVTIAKIAILAVFVAFGAWVTLSRPDWQVSFRDFLPHGYGGVFTAMGLTFVAFEGYEIIAQCSEEVRNPKRNVPRAVFLSLLVVVPIYLLVAFAALGATHVNGMPSWQFLGLKKETALVDVARGLFPGGAAIILVGGLLSTLSALNATIYSSSRVSFAMGRDRNLPSFFGRVHPARKTPHWAILASAVLIAFMAVALPIEAVASASDIMFLLLFIQVLLVLMVLRKRRPDLDRGFKVPWVPLVPIVGIVLQLALAVQLFAYSPKAWLSALAWIGGGLAVFYGYSRRRDRAYARVVAGREAAAHHKYRILACVGDPENAAVILGAASAVARRYQGEVLALAVLEVPEGELLAVGLDRVGEIRDALEQATSRLAAEGIPVRSLIAVSHRISYGIVEAALAEECNLIVLGRARRTSWLERFAATLVDRVVRSSPARVIEIGARRWPATPKTVLLAYEAGPNSQLAVELAQAFAGSAGASVRVVHVVPPEASTEQIEHARGEVSAAFARVRPPDDVRIVRSSRIVPGVLRESKGADLIVLGGSEAGLLEHLLGYALPLELADRTARPVAIVYEMPAEPTRWLV
jgi:amino acid transporter/nucleotide-binding universal stress UspA family protein